MELPNLESVWDLEFGILNSSTGTPIRLSFAAWCTLAAAVVGCGRVDDIDATYGRRRATIGAQSVNGTGVLAHMFEQAGHRVSTWRRLSPKLGNDRVIVWAPDSFELPSDEELDFLEGWLMDQSGRTLVYIARDYDAAATYWQHMTAKSPDWQMIEIERRLARSKSDHDLARAAVERRETDWFSVKTDVPRTPVDSLSGPWSEGIDASQTEIELAAQLVMPSHEDKQVTPLLQADDEQLLVVQLRRPFWGSSRVILVANGSFLLNLPLVNHEHRKLAGKLIDTCGPPGRVTFLESGADGLVVMDEDPKGHTGFEAFTVWPINVLLLHVTILGIVFCCMVFPIFGRPRDLIEDRPTDFGKHVRALGELLAFTQDRAGAVRRVQQYRQLAHHAAAKSTSESGNPFGTSIEGKRPQHA